MITDANLLLAGQHKADGSIEPQTVTAAAVSSNAVDLPLPAAPAWSFRSSPPTTTR